MTASTVLLRVLLALCVLAAPALAVGGTAACKRGEVSTCKGTVCCPGLTCSFTSTGGGFYCL